MKKPKKAYVILSMGVALANKHPNADGEDICKSCSLATSLICFSFQCQLLQKFAHCSCFLLAMFRHPEPALFPQS